MDGPSDVRAQLRSLAIPKDRRPISASHARSRAGWKHLIVLLLLVGLGGAGYVKRERIREMLASFGASTESNDPVRLITVQLEREPDPTPILTATGRLTSDHRVAVATKVSGQVVALFFEQGDVVKRGQILARIEDILYRARRDEAAARLAKSRAQLEFQRVNLDRVLSLRSEQSAQPIEWADAQRAFDEATAQGAADAASLAWTQKALDDTEVTAPIDGVILTRNVEVGDFVAAEGGRGANANAQFAIIADMTKLRVEVDVSELDIARIKTNMPCIITPDAYKDRRYRGSVMWLDPSANYSKATVQVKVRVENPEWYLRVEGSAQVSFYNEDPQARKSTDATPAIWIPTAACTMTSSSAGYVFMAQDGRLRMREVTLGRQSGTQIEVTAGLQPSESIVASGLDKIHDGQLAPR
ncbi:MAG: efflux RND transporter periplasmic adaptor subunit [Planctomycetota bacterium]